MKKETDLQKVKEIAGTMLMTPIHTTLYSPVIVQHPFTTSGITAVNGKDRYLALLCQGYCLRNKLHQDP